MSVERRNRCGIGRRALLGLLLVAIAAPLGCEDGAPAGPPRRLLVVTLDTLRADHVGAEGGPVATPGFDAVAAAVALVEDATTPMPTTGPAHASLWTGLHPWRHGVEDNAEALDPAIPTVAELARDAGVATGAFVSSYVLDARFGQGRGFETYHFEPTERYAWRGAERRAFWTLGARTTDAALGWLEEHAGGDFLIWVHYFDPHAPYAPPPGFARPATERIPLEGRSLPPGVTSFARLADLARAYRGDVAYTDAELRRLLDGLRVLGIDDTTAVVVTADHGEGLGDHGVLEHGETLFEELVRVPLAVKAPGIPAGRRLAGPAQLEDLAPTLLELLGVPVPPDLDGQSLLPWLRGERAESPRRAAIGRRKPYRDRPDLWYVRDAETKWIGTPGEAGTAYRLAADPREAAGTEAAAPDVLEAQRVLAARRAGARRTPPLDEESRAALEALGYLDE